MHRTTRTSAALALSLVLTSVAVLAAPAAKQDKAPDGHRILPVQPNPLVFKTTREPTAT